MIRFEQTFDAAALDYDSSRPLYPAALYTDLLCHVPLTVQSRVLEIGLGTGKASEQILRTGCSLTGLEPGNNLAALAAERLKGYANLSLLNCTLQDYAGEGAPFDLIYAATAFHWIEEEYGYCKVFKLLREGGSFARFAYHAGSDRSRPQLAQQIESLYQQYMRKGDKPSPPPKEFGREDAEALAAVALRYGFVEPRSFLYQMTKDFSAEEYLALLRTYPDHMALPEQKREGLFAGIANAIQQHGGTLTVFYTVDMELAQKPEKY